MRGREVARCFGYVPQQQSEAPLSVFETVLLGRRPYIRWAASERDYEVVERVLGLLQLEDLSLRSLDSLSGGEIQKVLLARALAQEPQVLLLDEPTSNLDLKNQLEVLRLILRAVREQGLSAIVSIHDLNLALRLGDAFLLLREGRVHAVATREGLTREIIREVYGVEVLLGEMAGYPVVVMLDTECAGPGGEGQAGS
jgi:iron complex transport system ATP-binding protein